MIERCDNGPIVTVRGRPISLIRWIRFLDKFYTLHLLHTFKLGQDNTLGKQSWSLLFFLFRRISFGLVRVIFVFNDFLHSKTSNLTPRQNARRTCLIKFRVLQLWMHVYLSLTPVHCIFTFHVVNNEHNTIHKTVTYKKSRRGWSWVWHSTPIKLKLW